MNEFKCEVKGRVKTPAKWGEITPFEAVSSFLLSNRGNTASA